MTTLLNLFLVISAAVAWQTPAVLDLTGVPYQVAPPAADSASPLEIGEPQIVRGESGSGGPKHRLPFRLALRSVAPGSCVTGDELLYELELTNVGREVVLVPWADSRELVAAATATAVDIQRLTVGLRVDDTTKSGAPLGMVSLAYGSSLAPGTLRPVAPRESVIVRARTKCQPQGPTAHGLRRGHGYTALVYAVVQIEASPDRLGLIAYSDRVKFEMRR